MRNSTVITVTANCPLSPTGKRTSENATTPDAYAFGHESNVGLATTRDELLLAAHEVEIQGKGKTPAVSIVAYTRAIMSVPGWGPLVIDLDGIDLSASQISKLADHDGTLKGIVGHGRAEVPNGKLIVSGTLTATTEAAHQLIELAKSGFEKGRKAKEPGLLAWLFHSLAFIHGTWFPVRD